MKRKLSEDICGGCSDVEYAEDRGDHSACCKPCPSPVPSDDCFDPCKTSSPSRRGGSSPRDDRGGSERGRRSRKSHRSASEICDDCLSMSSPSTRRRRSDDFYDDTPCCPPPRNPCSSEPRHDHHKASHRRTKNDDDGGGTRRGSISLSPCGDRETSDRGERRSERTAHVTRSQSHKRDDAFHHDTRDDSSLERTTTRTRTGGSCCPDPEERNCESESRSLFLKCSFL